MIVSLPCILRSHPAQLLSSLLQLGAAPGCASWGAALSHACALLCCVSQDRQQDPTL